MAITHISLHVQNLASLVVSCWLMVSQLFVDILVTDGVSVLFNGFDGLLNNGGFLDFTGRGKGVVDSHRGGECSGGGISNGGGSMDGGTVVASMSIGESSSIGKSPGIGFSMGKSTIDDGRVGNGQNGGKNEL